MRADCHMHMILDGYEWKGAIARHREKPDENFIHQVLSTYQKLGYTYLRDGGDRWNAGKRARELAAEYGAYSPYCGKKNRPADRPASFTPSTTNGSYSVYIPTYP